MERKSIDRYNDDFYLDFDGSNYLQGSTDVSGSLDGSNSWSVSWLDLLDRSASVGVTSLDQSSHTVFTNVAGTNGISITHRVITITRADILVVMINNGSAVIRFFNDVRLRTDNVTVEHLVLNYDHTTNTGSLYVDGRLHQSLSNFAPSNFASTQGIRLGADFTPNRLRVGSLRDVMIFDKALSENEIEYIYTTATPPNTAYSNLQHYYPLNQMPYENGGNYFVDGVAHLYNQSASVESLELNGWASDEIGVSNVTQISAFRDFKTKGRYFGIGLDYKENAQYGATYNTVNGSDFNNGYTVIIKCIPDTLGSPKGDIMFMDSTIGTGQNNYFFIDSAGFNAKFDDPQPGPPTGNEMISSNYNPTKDNVFVVTASPTSSGTFELFINGRKDQSSDDGWVYNAPDTSLYIGSNPPSSIKGIFYVAVFNSVLTDNQISTYSESDNWLELNPYMMWCSENDGTKLIDISGNGRDAIIQNSTAFNNNQTYISYKGGNSNYKKGLNFDSAKGQYLEVTGLEAFGNSGGYTFLVGVESDAISNQQNVFGFFGDEGVFRGFEIIKPSSTTTRYDFISPNITGRSLLSLNGVDVSKDNFLSYYTGDNSYISPYSSSPLSKIADVNVSQNYSSGIDSNPLGLGFDEITNPIFNIGARSSSQHYLNGKITFFCIIKESITKEQEKTIFNNGNYRSPYEVIEDRSRIILDVDFQNPFDVGGTIKFKDRSGNCEIIANQNTGTDWDTLAGVQASID